MGRDGEMYGRDHSSMLWQQSECVPSWVVRLRSVIRHSKLGDHWEWGEAHAPVGARTQLPLQVR